MNEVRRPDVIIEATNACDRHCIGCYAPNVIVSEGKRPISSAVRNLTALALSRALRNATTRGEKMEIIYIRGGEPTLNDEIDSIIEIAREHSDLVYLETHGRWLVGDNAKISRILGSLKGNGAYVKLSFDSMHGLSAATLEQTTCTQSCQNIVFIGNSLAVFNEIRHNMLMSFNRIINISNDLSEKSLFLLGPRQTGKSTYLKSAFPHALFINLLQPMMFQTLTTAPGRLSEIIASSPNSAGPDGTNLVLIDEIQKLPTLLDEIHDLIESDKRLRFVLTGSSARKLKRQGVNLLGGRARRTYFHPITTREFAPCAAGKTALSTLLQWGGLPSVLTSKNPKRMLDDYIGLYLKEEIQAEALVRSIEAYSRFLNTAAHCNAEQVNFTAVASDAGVPPRTVREYFTLLEDTLVGRMLPAFEDSKKRKAMTSAKFYFFDVGMANALMGRFSIKTGTPEHGKAFEHLIWRELQSYIDYQSKDVEIRYWRSTSKFEVDFVIVDKYTRAPVLIIEAKGKSRLQPKDFSGLRAFTEEHSVRKLVVCLEEHRRNAADATEVWPAASFFQALWAGEIF